MNTDANTLNNSTPYSPWWYLAATVIWTWGFWIPAGFIMVRSGGFNGLSPLGALGLLLLMQLGAYGPSLMAIAFTARKEGWQGIKNLLGKFLIWRVGIGWYAFVFLAPVIFLLGGTIVYRSITDLPLEFDPSLWPRIFVAFLIAIPFGPLGEELGWRGFGLPVLLAKTTAINASLVLGVVHALWHLPLFFAPIGTTISGLEITPWLILAFTANAIGLSILYTWVWGGTRGSVLMALLLHASYNAAVLFLVFPALDSEAQKYITLLSGIFIWIAAIVIMAKSGVRTLGIRNR